MTRRAYLGLGSNVGDRLAHLQAATAKLAATPGIELTAVSSVYETAPVGEIDDQRDFLNAVAQAHSDLEALELLRRLKEIERRVGRKPAVRHGPRVIDVDLLLLGDLRGSFGRCDDGTPMLVLPHPLNLERRFVLEPLLELDAELTYPGNIRLADALAKLGEGQRVTRIGGPGSLRFTL